MRTLTGGGGDAANGTLSLTGNVDSAEEETSPGQIAQGVRRMKSAVSDPQVQKP